MKKLLAIMFIVMAFTTTAFAQAADVTIAVTKSLDDPTPRVAVFPTVTINGVSYPSIFKYYVVEQNGSLLAQQCLPGCTSITVTGLADGTYSYRVAAVVESTRLGSDGLPMKVLSYGWSTAKSQQVLCVVANPAAPTLGLTSQVCK